MNIDLEIFETDKVVILENMLEFFSREIGGIEMVILLVMDVASQV